MNRDHPEFRCERCEALNVLWYAPDEAWNEVMDRSEYSRKTVLCPRCFALLADEHGWYVELYRAEMERV
jgi:hypothetical protein